MKRTASEIDATPAPATTDAPAVCEDSDTTPVNILVFDENGIMRVALHQPGGFAAMTPAERFVVRHGAQGHEKGDAADLLWSQSSFMKSEEDAAEAFESALDKFAEDVPEFTAAMQTELREKNGWTSLLSGKPLFVLPPGRTIIPVCIF